MLLKELIPKHLFENTDFDYKAKLTVKASPAFASSISLAIFWRVTSSLDGVISVDGICLPPNCCDSVATFKNEKLSRFFPICYLLGTGRLRAFPWRAFRLPRRWCNHRCRVFQSRDRASHRRLKGKRWDWPLSAGLHLQRLFVDFNQCEKAVSQGQRRQICWRFMFLMAWRRRIFMFPDRRRRMWNPLRRLN